MLVLEGYISNFTCASYTFLYGEFSDFYVNQFLAGQTIHISIQFQLKTSLFSIFILRLRYFIFMILVLCCRD
jgi:hypothetical protein